MTEEGVGSTVIFTALEVMFPQELVTWQVYDPANVALYSDDVAPLMAVPFRDQR